MSQNTEYKWVRLFKAGFMGMVVGCILALVLNNWVWLEMRINIGAMIPICAALFSFLGFWKRFNISIKVFFILETTLLFIFFLLYGMEWGALAYVPACLFREGCGVTFLNISTVNLFLLIALITGNSFYIVSPWKDSNGRASGY